MAKRSNNSPEAFSVTLQKWLKSDKDKSLAGLIDVFQEKAFAIIFLLMLALPALPIPTGGVTHVTELIAMLISLQLIIGRKTIWLPHKWLNKDVSKFLAGKAAQKLIGVIKWFERWSRRRWAGLLTNRLALSLIGLVVLIFTVAAFVAPPFSGLDTLPALGVVVISLALILEDSLLVLLGIIIGVVGIGVEIAAGAELYKGLTHFF
jgi:hypothetical protein